MFGFFHWMPMIEHNRLFFFFSHFKFYVAKTWKLGIAVRSSLQVHLEQGDAWGTVLLPEIIFCFPSWFQNRRVHVSHFCETKFATSPLWFNVMAPGRLRLAFILHGLRAHIYQINNWRLFHVCTVWGLCCLKLHFVKSMYQK